MKIPRKNQEIKAKKVRLISEKGENLGIKTIEEAFKIAQKKGLDLVEISPYANPPICKILDFGKYLYQQRKKEKKLKKKQKKGIIKEIRVSFRISEHDLEIKFKKVEKFFKEGFRVKVTMFLRGREKALKDFAKEKLKEILKELKKKMEFKIEGQIRKTGKGWEVVIYK